MKKILSVFKLLKIIPVSIRFTLLTLRQKNPTFQSGFLPSKERFSGICAAGNYVAELSVARSICVIIHTAL